MGSRQTLWATEGLWAKPTRDIRERPTGAAPVSVIHAYRRGLLALAALLGLVGVGYVLGVLALCLLYVLARWLL